MLGAAVAPAAPSCPPAPRGQRPSNPPPTLLPPPPQAKLRAKAPFSQYAALEARGAKVVFGNPADPASFPSGSFDAVYDNNGKDLDTCQPLIDAFKVRKRGGGRRGGGRLGEGVWRENEANNVRTVLAPNTRPATITKHPPHPPPPSHPRAR
jgi:hypothetical protein